MPDVLARALPSELGGLLREDAQAVIGGPAVIGRQPDNEDDRATTEPVMTRWVLVENVARYEALLSLLFGPAPETQRRTS